MRCAVLWVAVAIGCADNPLPPDQPPGDEPTEFANDNDADGFEPPFDCDDEDAEVYPGHAEFCNGVDDDCDDVIDDNALDADDGFVDADGDGAGDSSLPLVSCIADGWAPVGGDCDDADPARAPTFTEACNGIDDDCSDSVDDGAFLESMHYQTIQDAILAAEEGATVELCPDSTQLESGILVDRDVTVTSEVGDPMRVTIDGLLGSSVFVVDGGDLTLDALTIRGGLGMLSDIELVGEVTAGGGVNALNGAGGHLVVLDCIFEDNAAAVGGAIAAVSLEVSDSSFVGNVAEGENYSSGGALWVAPRGSFTVERTTFERNAANLGGALQVWSSGLLVDVEGFDNSVVNVFGGSGGFAHASTVAGDPITTLDLVRTDIHDNLAGQGGGLQLYEASGSADEETVIHDNMADRCGGLNLESDAVVAPYVAWSGGTFESNTVDSAFGDGGGLCLDTGDGGAIDVADVVIQDNLGFIGGGMSLGNEVPLGGTVVIRNSTVTRNMASIGAGISTTAFGGPPEAANVFLEDVEISENDATDNGGGLWAQGAWIAIAGGALRDNTAGLGGGVFLSTSSIVEAAATDFSGNQPQDVWFHGGAGYDAADVAATFICTAADKSCQ